MVVVVVLCRCSNDMLCDVGPVPIEFIATTEHRAGAARVREAGKAVLSVSRGRAYGGKSLTIMGVCKGGPLNDGAASVQYWYQHQPGCCPCPCVSFLDDYDHGFDGESEWVRV